MCVKCIEVSVDFSRIKKVRISKFQGDCNEMQSNEMQIMLLHVKVSDNLRISKKLKHKSAVKIYVTVGHCLEFPQKISILILY